MTFLAVPIFVGSKEDVAAALDDADAAVRAGAAMIEWRVDELAGDAGAGDCVGRLLAESPAACIVTCRAPGEGGIGDGTEEDRVALLEAAVSGDARPRYVDIELAATRGAQATRYAALVGRLTTPGGGDEATGLILSAHDFDRRPADLLQRIEAMTRDPACAVVKVAWTARSLRDNLEAFDLLAERQKPTIALCMGPFGLMSRVLAPKFRGLVTFASPAAGAESAPGQPTLEDLRTLYRFDTIGPATRVYGVVGWPVGHSRSPRLHNAAFDTLGIDAVYLPLPVPPEYEHFKATVGALVDHPRLDFRGASVTLPHKTHLIRFVRERGGRVDGDAERIGAANTLVVGAAGGLGCLNTDASAAVSSLAAGLSIDAAALADGRVAIIGAGGVARAVAVALRGAGARVVVMARSAEKSRALADELGLETGDVRALAQDRFDVIVNATPVGMEGGPDPDGSPLPDDAILNEHVTVFDTVYQPARTPLVREAEARGARVVTGVDMFVRQAAAQLEAWTGETVGGEVLEGFLE